MTVSMVKRCHDVVTHPISFEEIWKVTRDGDHGLKDKINQIRNRYEAEKDITGSPEKAKKAIAALKLELPGFLPSGTFSKRANEALIEHSGILCADLDGLGERLPLVRDSLKDYPEVWAVALSPSGDGLKVFFNVVKDPSRHEDSFRAIKQFLHDEANIFVDEKCKDPARICFFTYDPDLWVSSGTNVPIRPLDPVLRAAPRPASENFDLETRRRVSEARYRIIQWETDTRAYIECPGQDLHTNKNQRTDCWLNIDGGPNLFCVHQSCGAVIEQENRLLPSLIGKAEYIKRPDSHFSYPYRDVRSENPSKNGSQPSSNQPLKDFLTFYSVSGVKSYVPPPGLLLVGDYHIVRGATTVIAGPPDVGKSRASVYLAACGATQQDFFGLKVHTQFKTMILQCENGLYRLKNEFSGMDNKYDDFIRISDPPPYGFLFKRSDFRAFLKDRIAQFAPGILVIDPWNRVEHGQDSKDYLDSFDLILSILPEGDQAPALVINAHHRKSSNEGVGTGRSLLKELSGGLALGSIPRTVFAMLHASDDTEETRIVWTCCKNNDGELGKRSAWERKDASFSRVDNFDWAEFDSASKNDKRVMITEEMVAEVFSEGPLIRTMARDKLKQISGATQATVYRALSEKGRFVDHLVFKKDTIDWIRKT